MSVREYIGARYVPVFADPIQWDITNKYEPLTVVTDQGASYVSRRYVPEGIQLSNTDYWVLWADFNAQLQHYIDEVDAFDGRIDALEDAMPIADFSSVNTVSDAIDDLGDLLPASAFDSVNTVDAAIDAVSDLLPASSFDSVNTVNAAIGAVNSTLVTVENKLASLEPKTHMVVIGDSYSRPGDGLSESAFWYYQLAQKLGLTYHRYAVGGCGFVQGTTPYSVQISNAAVDSSFDNNDVGLVIIFGGVNDCYNNFNISGYKATVKSALALAISSFPNAHVILAGVNTFRTIWSQANHTWQDVTVYHTTKELEAILQQAAIETFGVTFIPFMRQMCGMTEWFQNSGIGHPNADGQTAIANIFLNALRGIPYQYSAYRLFLVSPMLGSGTFGFAWNSYDFSIYASNFTYGTYTDSAKYCMVEVPFGLEALLPGGMSEVTCPVGIAGTKTTEKNLVVWGYLYDVAPDLTPTDGYYAQKQITVRKHPDSSSAGCFGR